MQVFPCNQTTYWDVDDTLILWSPTEEQIAKYGISYITPSGNEVYVVPHLPHVEQLKRHADRGHTTIVWSAGGYQWAAEAVRILGLEKYVDLVISKPTWFYDDKQPEDFMGKPQFLKMQD